ncbi:MAG: hypothetical protein ABSF44_09455 [Candidatus Bathyarchaeia archaeon]|jgi:hypothetical protein
MNPQDEIQTELLREILKWTKFSGMKAVKEVLISTLETAQERLLYQLSNGSKGSVELCKITKIASTETVTRHWKTWAKLGIGENMSVQGGKRFKRAFDLEEFGIEVPKPESGESDDQVQQLSDKKAE